MFFLTDCSLRGAYLCLGTARLALRVARLCKNLSMNLTAAFLLGNDRWLFGSKAKASENSTRFFFNRRRIFGLSGISGFCLR